MMTDTLPPPPLPTWDDSDYCPPSDDAFSADQMRAYAIAVRDAAVAAERERWTTLYWAVNDLMAFMGYHGSANARGDHAQAVMDALHDLDAARATAPAEKE